MSRSTATKITRWLGWSLLTLIVLLLLLLFGGRWWLLQTRSGGSFVLDQAQRLLSPALNIRGGDGTLADGMRLHQVSYSDEISRTELASLDVAVELHFLPRPRVHISKLHARDVQVTVLPSTAPPMQQLPDLRSPLPLRVDDLRISNISVLLPDQTQPLRIEQLQASFSYAQSLDLRQLTLRAYAAELQASGELAMQPQYQHELQLDVSGLGEQLLPDLQQTAISFRSVGSLEQLQLTLSSSDGAQVHADVQLSSLLQNPQWRLQLVGNTDLHWPLASTDAAQIELHKLDLSSSGNLDDYQLRVQSTVLQPQLLAGDWQLQLQGDRQQLNLQQLSGQLLQGAVQAQGRYQLSPALHDGQLQLQLSRLQVDELLAQSDQNDSEQNDSLPLPAISGGLALTLADATLHLTDLDLQASGLDWRLQGSGDYDLDSAKIRSDWRWQALDWPPGSAAQAQWRSKRGTLSANGTLEQLQLQLAADLAGASVPPMQLQMRSLLQPQSMQLQQLQVQTLDGQLHFKGTASWAEQLQTRLEFSAADINPGLFWPSYSGQLTAQGQLSASAAEDFSAPRASLTIDSLSGQLRGQPISGAGTLDYADQRLVSDGLKLQSGDASLSLQADQDSMQLDLDIPAIGQLYAAGSGNLNATISMQALPGDALRLDRGKLQLQLTGSDLGWQQQAVDTLQWQAELELGDRGLLGESSLEIERWSADGQQYVSALQLHMNSQLDSQQLSISGIRAGSQLQLLLAGASAADQAFTPWTSDFSWLGQVRDMQITDRQLGSWQQQHATRINYTDQTLQLQPTCLLAATEAADSELCIAVQQLRLTNAAPPIVQANVALTRLPLALLAQLSGLEFISDQTLSGQIDISIRDQLETLNATMALSEGRLFIPGDRERGVLIEQAELHAQLVDDVLSGDVLLGIEQQGEINSHWQYAPFSAASAELSGDLNATLPDLSLLQGFVPVLNELGGSLTMQARFQGPLAQPLIALDLNLQEGLLSYAPTATRFSNIHLQGQSEPGQLFTATGGLQAGTGQATLQLQLDPNKRVGSVSIKGEDLQLADSNVLQLHISPDMSFASDEQGFHISGELLIPSALLKPPANAVAQQAESADVVIVGAAQPVAEKQHKELALYGDLKLVLGKAVRVDADAATTNLEGTVNLVWDGQLMPIADGSINLVDGKVQAYGQTLVLRDSRVSYNQVAVDNPRLDIYAVRRVFGDPVVNEAGVSITGKAQNPNIRLFTNPASSEENALAYIATGSNFDHGNGDGALNLGLYLFPRLFVSYGVGLFDNGNVTNARYELSNNWNLTLESGQRDSAVQINWRKNSD